MNVNNREQEKKRFWGKQIMILALCVCMFLGTAGCGSEEGSGPDSSSSSQETQIQTGAETAEEQDTKTDENDVGELRIAAEEGCQAPDIELNYLDGSSARLSDYRGKAVLLNLWATWCGPCVNEMPAFPRLQEEFGEKLQLIALNCGESADTVEAFAKEKGYSFPMAVDEEYEVMMGAYRTSSIPYTVVIDAKGVIRHISVGAGDADTMFESYKAAIEEALRTGAGE